MVWEVFNLKKKSLSVNLKRIFGNGAFVFILALGVEALTFKNPYCMVLGTFLVLTSFIFFPWLDKVCTLIGFKMRGKNKCFIVIVNLFITAYLIKPQETNYYKCILPIVLMIITWVITIIYEVKKSRN